MYKVEHNNYLYWRHLYNLGMGNNICTYMYVLKTYLYIFIVLMQQETAYMYIVHVYVMYEYGSYIFLNDCTIYILQCSILSRVYRRYVFMIPKYFKN